MDATYQEDASYVRDLGLLAPDRPLRIANPIYREVIVRVLGPGPDRSVRADAVHRADGKRAWQREALELKVWVKGKPDPKAQGLLQLEGYLERLGLDRGVLVIFDRRPKAAPIHKRTRFQKARTPKRYPVTLLRA